jgi:hypothetical protein
MHSFQIADSGISNSAEQNFRFYKFVVMKYIVTNHCLLPVHMTFIVHSFIHSFIIFISVSQVLTP